jgi:acyl carrier protein
MMLITAIEEAFAIEFETSEIEAMKDVRGVRTILRAHGAQV